MSLERACRAVLRERGLRIRQALQEAQERLSRPEAATARPRRPRAVAPSVARSTARRAAEAARRQRLLAELGYSGIGRRHPGAVVFEVAHEAR